MLTKEKNYSTQSAYIAQLLSYKLLRIIYCIKVYNNTQVAHIFDKFLLVNKNCVNDAISEANQEMKNVDMCCVYCMVYSTHIVISSTFIIKSDRISMIIIATIIGRKE